MNDQDLNGLVQRLRGPLSAEFLNLHSGYASGSWTPYFIGSGGGGTVTYANQVGQFTRLGNVIVVQGYLLVNVVSAVPFGSLQVAGFPYTTRATTNGFQILAIGQYGNLNLTAGCIDLGLRLDPSGTTATLVEAFDNAGAGALPAAALNNVAQLIFGGVYLAEVP